MDPLRAAARRDAMGPAVEGPPASPPRPEGTDGPAQPVAWSWSDLDRRADRAALRLTEAGVGPGDAVAAVLPPSPEAVVLLHAVPRVGALWIPLNPGWPVGEMRLGLAGLGRPRLLLVPRSRVDRFREAWPGTGVVAVDEIAPAGVGTGGEGDPDQADPTLRLSLPDPSHDTPVAVLLTSGTSRRPRAVPLTQGNLTASARGAAERLGLGPMDAWLASLSPAHVGGLALLHRAAVVGCPVVTRPRFDPVEFLALARQGEVTHASVVPTMLRGLLDAAEAGHGGATGPSPPRGLRCLLVGGAPTPRPLLERALAARWPVALTYGLTEATSQVATAAPAQVREKPGSVGRPLPGVVMAIQASGRGPGRAPGRGDEGEILVRGPTVALLAPGAPAAESGARAVHLDGAGWLHTGDLGRVDDDGDLWITGRLSDRIVTGGVTVDPAQVEEVLARHPGVREVAVVGAPDPEWGERVVAVVVPDDPAAPPSAGELLGFSRPLLAAAKRPREVRVLEALPRNPGGKVDRRALRGLVGGGGEAASG